ncbi:MAG: RtcB family protein [Bacillota bacterium]
MKGITADGQNRWRIAKSGSMRVDAVVYMNPRLKEQYLEKGALDQLAAAAELPGVIDPVVGMPDLHQGYGLPIGGVMAVSAEEEDLEESIVSAGAVGYDINCGVRLLATELDSEGIEKGDLRALIDAITTRIPPGVGKSSAHESLGVGFEEVVIRGAAALVEAGYGRSEDLEATEESGALGGARLGAVTAKARERADQLATIGGGNHFIEIGEVAEVYDAATAAAYGLYPGKITVMIHTGSRGFGHEICGHYTKLMARSAQSYSIALPNKGLACVPIGSRPGRDYLAAMACATNYAFANRQLMTYQVRRAFDDVIGWVPGLAVVYDVAHNMAKFERHRGRKTLVHRKGATRALPPGHGDNPPRYRETGHPALVPGSMGTSSFVLVGTHYTAETFHSVNHGAGRVMSRTQARRSVDVDELHRQLGEVIYGGVAPHRVLDEAPAAYKDIEDVVATLADVGITRRVVRLRPRAVIKGA